MLYEVRIEYIKDGVAILVDKEVPRKQVKYLVTTIFGSRPSLKLLYYYLKPLLLLSIPLNLS